MNQFKDIKYSAFYDNTNNDMSIYHSVDDLDENILNDHDTNTNTNNTNNREQSRDTLQDNLTSISESKKIGLSTTNYMNSYSGYNNKHKTKKYKPNKYNRYVNADTLQSYQTLDDLHQEVQDNVNICRSNINRLEERDVQLNKIQENTQRIASHSNKFKNRSHRIRRQMLCEYIFHILGIIFFTILFIVLFVILLK